MVSGPGNSVAKKGWFADAMTMESLRMDSPAPLWTQGTSQETRSHSLTPMLSVSKPILTNEIIVLEWSMDIALACTGCTWTISVSVQFLICTGEHRYYVMGQIGPSPWLMNTLKMILVVVFGFAISISLNQLGSCGLTASRGSDQMSDFEWTHCRALLSKMVWMNGKHMILRLVIFLCT